MCIFGIYLPYYDSSLDQYKLYMDTLDQLHVLIEQIDKNIPVLIMGDTNTVLPESDQLSVNWYHKRLFTKWSAILYEFLHQNDMCVGNFQFEQHVNHTYRQHSQELKSSYIDHIFIRNYLCDQLNSCQILCDDQDNMSDHLAAQCQHQYESYCT